MLFKNALKIMLSKFSLVWSILLYGVIVVGVIGGITTLLWIPTFGQLVEMEILREVTTHMTALTSGEMVFNRFMEELAVIYSRVFETIMSHSFAVFGTGFLVLIVGRLATGVMSLPVHRVLEGMMSSNARYSLVGKFFSSFKKSIRFQLSKILFTLPFDIVSMFLMYGTFLLLRASGATLFAPFVMIVEFILINAFKHTLFCNWTPMLAVENGKIFPTLRRSLKLSFLHFGKIFSLFAVTQILAMSLLFFTGVFTLGVGLLFSIPVVLIFHDALSMAICYTYTKRRYYLDSATVFTPPGTDLDSAREDSV